MLIPFPVEEYRKAVEQESAARRASFLDSPEVVCGIAVRQMTLRDVILLDGISSPFIAGKRLPNPEDIVVFLFCLSPQFKASKFALWRFTRRCRDIDYAEAVKAIRDYIEAAFMDAPNGSGAECLTYYSWAAGLVDLLAREYHWAESDILDMPLKRLWQYRRTIIKRLDPGAALNNPSMEIRRRWLEEVNRGN